MGLGVLLSNALCMLSKQKRLINTFLFLTVLMTPTSLFFISYFQSAMDADSFTKFNNWPITSLLQEISAFSNPAFYFKIFFSLGLPFLTYGIFISLCLRVITKQNIIYFYTSELLGILLGTSFVLLFLDQTSYGFILFIICLFGQLAIVFSAPRVLRWTSVILFVPTLCHLINSSSFEPKRNLSWAIRDFHQTSRPIELRRDWTTYAKVQTISVHRANQESRVISLGDGTGIARLYQIIDGNIIVPSSSPDKIASALTPKKVLVIFAGAGADLFNINRELGGQVDLTGVEVNPMVIDQALSVTASPLKGLLTHKNIRLLREEGRHFLQQEREKYDLILFSWSGATSAHYSGAVMHTTQYAFTTEALQQAYNKTNPGGHIVIFGASKINLMLSFIKFSEAAGIEPATARKSVLLLGPEQVQQDSIFSGWDDFTLIIKKGEWTSNQIDDLELKIKPISYVVWMSPFKSHTQVFQPIYNMFDQPNYLQVKNFINKETGLHFSEHADDQPFVFNISPTEDVVSLNFLNRTLQTFFSNNFNDSRHYFLGATLSISVVLFVLLILFSLRSPLHVFYVTESSFVSWSTGFFSTGLAIMMIYKALLFFGNPTTSVVFAQAAAGVGGLCGALLSMKAWSKPKLALFIGIAILILSKILANILLRSSGEMIIKYPFLGFIIFALIFLPLMASSSFIFCKNLTFIKSVKNSYTTMVFSLNLFGAGLAGIIIPLAVENYGISKTSTFIWSALFVALVMRATGTLTRRSLRQQC